VLDDDDAWATHPVALDWIASGYDLCRRLREQVGPAVEIVYFDDATGDNVQIP
jgi:hypothetical protein